MLDFLFQYQNLFIYIGIISLLLFVITALLTPYLVGLIPDDYFLASYIVKKNSFIISFIKNILGLFLLIIGFIMLFMPGQGVITMIFGIFIMNFPYKRRIERYFINKNSIFNALNWLRVKANKKQLLR